MKKGIKRRKRKTINFQYTLRRQKQNSSATFTTFRASVLKQGTRIDVHLKNNSIDSDTPGINVMTLQSKRKKFHWSSIVSCWCWMTCHTYDTFHLAYNSL